MLNWEELKIGVNLKKKGLIISILKSEGSNAEHNYMTHFNINTNVNNNTDDDDDDDDDKIRDKTSEFRMILSWLGNIVTKNDRKKIKKELYENYDIQNSSNIKDCLSCFDN